MAPRKLENGPARPPRTTCQFAKARPTQSLSLGRETGPTVGPGSH